jgi:hypothetical protein
MSQKAPLPQGDWGFFYRFIQWTDPTLQIKIKCNLMKLNVKNILMTNASTSGMESAN